jgi:hypothetical protein
MKRNNSFNKPLVLLALFITGALFLSSCIKNYTPTETNFSGLQPTLSIVEGGLAQFGSQSLVYPATDVSDTTIFRVDYAAVNVAPTNEVVTLAIDTAAVAAYNAANGLSGSAAFQVMPDSLYSYSTTSVTIAQGQTYSPAIPFVVFPDKIDPSVSYMLPIKITGGANGATISGNYGEIYYHVIGNPYAGTYEEYWSRWNATDTSSGSDGAFYYQYDVGPVTFEPNSATEVQVGSEGTGETDIIDFTDGPNGTFTDFTVSFPQGEAGILGLTSIGPPVFTNATNTNLPNAIFEIYFPYVNSIGAPRVIVDKYVKQ